MHKGRLEAFSDGVLAIIITIMVLEIKVPHAPDLEALVKLAPVFFSYVLSFIYVGIYWNNHHHTLQVVRHVDGRVLWANLALLFFLSLVPFASGWMGENHFAQWPVALYGVVLLCAALAYTVLLRVLVRLHGPDSAIAKAIGRDRKGNASIFIYVISVALTFLHPMLGFAGYCIVAVMWLVPDTRMARVAGEG